jgi:hypothetical protein
MLENGDVGSCECWEGLRTSQFLPPSSQATLFFAKEHCFVSETAGPIGREFAAGGL